MFSFAKFLPLSLFDRPRDKGPKPAAEAGPAFPFFNWLGGEDPAPTVPEGMTTREGVPLSVDYAQQWVDAQTEMPPNVRMMGDDLADIDPDATVESSDRETRVNVSETEVGGSHKRSKSVAKGDVEETDADEIYGSVGATGIKVGDKRTTSTKVGDGLGESTASVSDSRELEIGVDHAEARVARERAGTGDKADDKYTTTAAAGVADGKVHVKLGKGEERRRQVAEKDVTGNDVLVDKTSGEQSSTSVAANTSEATVAHTRSRTGQDGMTDSTGYSGTVNWDEGKASGEATWGRTDKDGKGTAYSAGGGVDVGPNGIQGVEASGSAKAGWVKVKGKAGIDVDVTEPKLVDGKYVVHWRRTVSAGGGVGAEGKRAGASAGASGSSYEMGTRTFSSEAEAKAFHDDADSITRPTGPSPTTLDGAYQLAIGESRGEGTTLGVEGGVTGTAGGVTVGASGTMNSQGQIEVRRASANIFEVTVSDSSGEGMTGSLGGYGITASKGESSSESHLTTVRFDVTTPEGKAAFEEYCRTKEVPKEGGQVVVHEQGKGHETSEGLDLMGIGGSKIAGRTWEKTRWDEEGKHEEYGGARSHDVNYRYLGKWLGGDETHKSFQLVGKQEDDQTTGYIIEGRFSGESALSNLDGMYQLSGRDDDRTRDQIGDGKASGNWKLSAELDMEEVDAYCEYIANNRDFDYGEIHDFQERIRNAENNDEKMRAVAAYVAGRGHKGLKNLGAQDLDYDVELEGDPNFPGRNGRLELEAKMEGYGGLLEASGANGPAVVHGLQSEIDALRARREAVADMDSYDDLPLELRQEELAKIDAYIAGFTGLRNQAAEEAVMNVAGEDLMGMMDREAADEEGKGMAPADPKQKALYELRNDIARLQLNTREMVGENTRARDAIYQAIDSSYGLRSGDILEGATRHRTEQRIADGLDQQRRNNDIFINELRMAFLRNMSDPDAAMVIGNQLVAQLRMQESLAYDAGVHYAEAARATATITKDEYRADNDYWTDLAEQEAFDAEPVEPDEIEIEPMDVREEKKKSRGRKKAS